MEKNFMNKMDDMEMDKVAGGARGNRGNDVKKVLKIHRMDLMINQRQNRLLLLPQNQQSTLRK